MNGRSIFLVLFLAACGGGHDGPNLDPEQACRDLFDDIGDLCGRCSATYSQHGQCYDAVRNAAALQVADWDGDCSNVVGVRDEAELYDQCLPYLLEVPCYVVETSGWMVDSSCQGQLLLRE